MAHDHPGQTFDERAATWDDPAKIERARTIARRIGEEVDLADRPSLFEYGAGTGLVSEQLIDQVGPVTLADSSAGMREQMQRKVDDQRLEAARIWEVDLSHDAPPEDEHFGLIVTSMVLHHVTDIPRTLRAFATMLEPAGHLCIVDLDAEDGSFHGPDVDVHHGFDRGECTAWLHEAGFGDVQISDCGTVAHDDAEYGLFLAVATR